MTTISIDVGTPHGRAARHNDYLREPPVSTAPGPDGAGASVEGLSRLSNSALSGLSGTKNATAVRPSSKGNAQPKSCASESKAM